MRRILKLRAPFLLLLAFCLLACSDDNREVIPFKDVADQHVSTAGSDVVPDDNDVDPDPIRSPTMESWAQSVADDMTPPELPGHYRISFVAAEDIDGDEDIDSIGAFGIYPGGLYAWSYVAVFLWKNDHLAFDASIALGIGGSTQYAYSIDSVRDRRIFLDMAVWKSGDGHCCPSDSAKWVLQWRPGELIQEE